MRDFLFNIYFLFTLILLLAIAFLEIFKVLDRRTRIVIVVLLLLFLIFSYLVFSIVISRFLVFGLAIFIATCLIIFYLMWGVIFPKSEIWGKVFWHGDSNEQVVALTFDDGPTPENTPQILEILKEYSVKATFFMVGQNIRRHREIARQVHTQGHAIGNHSYSHPVLVSERKGQIRREVLLTDRIIRQLIGKRPFIFRPPHGFKDPRVFNIAKELHYIIVSWSNMPEDWKDIEAQKIAERVLERAEPGDIVLLHDGDRGEAQAHRGETVKSLPMIIEGLLAENYSFKTIPEMLGESDWILQIFHRLGWKLPQ